MPFLASPAVLTLAAALALAAAPAEPVQVAPNGRVGEPYERLVPSPDGSLVGCSVDRAGWTGAPFTFDDCAKMPPGVTADQANVPGCRGHAPWYCVRFLGGGPGSAPTKAGSFTFNLGFRRETPPYLVLQAYTIVIDGKSAEKTYDLVALLPAQHANASYDRVWRRAAPTRTVKLVAGSKPAPVPVVRIANQGRTASTPVSVRFTVHLTPSGYAGIARPSGGNECTASQCELRALDPGESEAFSITLGDTTKLRAGLVLELEVDAAAGCKADREDSCDNNATPKPFRIRYVVERP